MNEGVSSAAVNSSVQTGELNADSVNQMLTSAITHLNANHILHGLIALIIILIINKFLFRFIKKMLVRTSLNRGAKHSIILGIKIVVYLIDAMIILSVLGVNMSSLLVLISALSLGLTLAAESMVGNIVSGVVLMTTRPFSLDDYVQIGEFIGKIHSIKLNFTEIYEDHGAVVVIPNKVVASTEIINYTTRGTRRLDVSVEASYDDPTEKVKAAARRVCEEYDLILSDPAPRVFIEEFANSNIVYKIHCWTGCDDYFPAKFGFYERLREAFEDAGIEISYQKIIIDNVSEK